MNELITSLHLWDVFLSDSDRGSVLEKFWSTRRGLRMDGFVLICAAIMVMIFNFFYILYSGSRMMIKLVSVISASWSYLKELSYLQMTLMVQQYF